jgi:hypothetical protein
MRTLRLSGLAKVREGRTTIEEIVRVTVSDEGPAPKADTSI